MNDEPLHRLHQTEIVTYLIQVQHEGVWITMPGFSGSDRSLLQEGIDMLSNLSQPVRVVKESITASYEVESDSEVA